MQIYRISNVNSPYKRNSVNFKSSTIVKPTEVLFKEACRLFDIIYDIRIIQQNVFSETADKTLTQNTLGIIDSNAYKLQLAEIIKQLQEYHFFDNEDGLEKYFKHFLSEMVKRDFKGFKVKILSCKTIQHGKDFISDIWVHAEKGLIRKTDKEDVLYRIVNGQLVKT